MPKPFPPGSNPPRPALLSPLPQGPRSLRPENRPVRARARGQDGFLPEPPQREGTRPGRPALHWHHPLRGEGRCESRVCSQDEDQPHRRRRIPAPAPAPGRVQRPLADREAARRSRARSPATKEIIMAKKSPTLKSVETLKHDEAKRKNIPTAEHQSVVQKKQEAPRTVKYPRNTDLDPQLVWRGKDEQDWSDLVVHAPPLYIQEKVHPKVLIDDLLKQTKGAKTQEAGSQAD